ncbi:MAG TPA: hypothetical protein VFY14_01670 [Streptomyces sp.]|nr:hypothetical protein [Streptomyces sp.]
MIRCMEGVGPAFETARRRTTAEKVPVALGDVPEPRLRRTEETGGPFAFVGSGFPASGERFTEAKRHGGVRGAVPSVPVASAARRGREEPT